MASPSNQIGTLRLRINGSLYSIPIDSRNNVSGPAFNVRVNGTNGAIPIHPPGEHPLHIRSSGNAYSVGWTGDSGGGDDDGGTDDGGTTDPEPEPDPEPEKKVVDDFESGDLSWYGSSSNEVRSVAARAGNYGLLMDQTSSTTKSHSNSSVPYPPEAGDHTEFWFKPEDYNGSAYYDIIWGIQEVDDHKENKYFMRFNKDAVNFYAVVNRDRIGIMTFHDVYFNEGEWYRCDLNWHDNGFSDNEFTIGFYEEDGTLMEEQTEPSDHHQGGQIAYWVNSHTTLYFDEWIHLD